MKNGFTAYTMETVPKDSRKAIQTIQEKYPMIPNLAWIMSGSPLLINLYMQISKTIETQSKFTPVELQIIYLVTSKLNGCHYCVAAHSTISTMAGINEKIVIALREGTELQDPKLENLRQFTIKVNHSKGHLAESDIESFIDSGYTREQILELIVCIALKVLSNTTNAFAGTDLDEAFHDWAWFPMHHSVK